MSNLHSRVWGLFRKEYTFVVRCFCKQCKSYILKITKENEWELIREGLYEEINNQKIMLNKLYGKS